MIYASEITQMGGAAPVFDTVLTGSDALSFDARRQQLLVLRNDGGASAALHLVGDEAGVLDVRGYGPVDLADGLPIEVPAASTVALVLGSVYEFARGTVRLVGGDGVVAQLLQVSGPRSWIDRRQAELLDLAMEALPHG